MPFSLPVFLLWGLLFGMNYAEQLKSPKWQKVRLKIMEMDNFCCQMCLSTTDQLHVHHIFYIHGVKIWAYPDEYLITLCEDCHKELHKVTDRLMKAIVKHYSERLHKRLAINAYLLSLIDTIKLEYHDAYLKYEEKLLETSYGHQEEH